MGAASEMPHNLDDRGYSNPEGLKLKLNLAQTSFKAYRFIRLEAGQLNWDYLYQTIKIVQSKKILKVLQKPFCLYRSASVACQSAGADVTHFGFGEASCDLVQDINYGVFRTRKESRWMVDDAKKIHQNRDPKRN